MAPSACDYQEDENKPFTCCSGTVYFVGRTLVVLILCLLAFVIPSINILLTIAGALLGTVVNIVLPVLFYNRAYTWSPKNRRDEAEEGKEDEPRNLGTFCE